MADIQPRRSINRTHGPDAPHGQFRVVGKRARKVDGIHKATGQALSTDDIQLPGMLHGKILRSPHAARAHRAHRRLAGAGAAGRARGRSPGRTCPIRYGIIPWTPDENALALDKVRFVGDARRRGRGHRRGHRHRGARADRGRVRARCRRSSIRTRRWRAPTTADPRRTQEGQRLQARRARVRRRRRRAGRSADVVIEDEYYFEGTTHAPIEPHCARRAGRRPTGVLTVWSATQIPHYLHRELARVLELPPQPHPRDPAAARRRLRRQERAVRPRVLRRQAGDDHRAAGEVPLHARGGLLRAPRPPPHDDALPDRRDEGRPHHRGRRQHPHRRRRLLAASGWSPRTTPASSSRGRTLPDATASTATRVFTNKPPCGPKRGHGSVQPRFAFEVPARPGSPSSSASIRSSSAAGTSWAPTRRRSTGMRVTSNGFLRVPRRVEARAAAGRTRARQAARRAAGSGVGRRSMYISRHQLLPSIPTRCRRPAVQLQARPLRPSRPCSPARNDIGQGSQLRCWRASWPRSWACASTTCAWSRPTPTSRPVDLGAYSVAHHVHGRQRRHRRRAQAARSSSCERGRREAGQSRRRVRMIARRRRDRPATIRQQAPRPRARPSSWPRRKFDTLGAVGSLQHARARRRLPRRHDRRVAGLLASPRTWPRSRSTSRPACQRARASWIAHDCGTRDLPAHRRGADGGHAYMGSRRGAAGAARRRPGARRLAQRPSPARLPIPTSLDTPEIAGAHRRVASIPKGPTARRRPARARCTARSPRSRTRSTTRSACGSPSCRSRRRGCWQG